MLLSAVYYVYATVVVGTTVGRIQHISFNVAHAITTSAAVLRLLTVSSTHGTQLSVVLYGLDTRKVTFFRFSFSF